MFSKYCPFKAPTGIDKSENSFGVFFILSASSEITANLGPFAVHKVVSEYGERIYSMRS